MTEHDWPGHDPDGHDPDGDEYGGTPPHHDPGPAADGDPLRPDDRWAAHPWPEQHDSEPHWSEQHESGQRETEQHGSGQSWHDEEHHAEPAGPHDDAAAGAVPGTGMTHVGADPDAFADAPAVDVFPPPVHVGPLPEPSDGFPWIDVSALGESTPATATPDPQESAEDLAAYAGQDLPGGEDGWHRLATSDDPAVAALARFWRPTT